MIKRGQHVEVIKGFYIGDTGTVRQYVGDKYRVDHGEYVGNWFYERELKLVDPPVLPETWWSRLCKLWPFY